MSCRKCRSLPGGRSPLAARQLGRLAVEAVALHGGQLRGSLPAAHCRLPTADCRLPTADCPLPTADCRLPTADCFQPCFLPEEKAAPLAAAVGRAVAAEPFEKHGVLHAPHAETFDASSLGATKYAEGLAAKGDHFRHERHPFQLRVGVEGGKNLARTANGDRLASPELHVTVWKAACAGHTPFSAEPRHPSPIARTGTRCWQQVRLMIYATCVWGKRGATQVSDSTLCRLPVR